jgi:hypothetical protein
VAICDHHILQVHIGVLTSFVLVWLFCSGKEGTLHYLVDTEGAITPGIASPLHKLNKPLVEPLLIQFQTLASLASYCRFHDHNFEAPEHTGLNTESYLRPVGST